jgi:hypothetical protein
LQKVITEVHPKETEERKLILIRPKLEWDMDLEKRIKDIITGLERIRVGCKKLFCGRSFTINKERYCSITGSCTTPAGPHVWVYLLAFP